MTGIPNTNRRGFTLVELMITVGLFTVIIAIAVGGFTTAIRTQRQVASLISAQSNVSLVLEQMAREVRTGYLFCHKVGPDQPPLSACGCTVDAVTKIWTCNALNFYDSEGQHVEYMMSASGTLMKANNVDNSGNGTFQSITGDNVIVHNLQFILMGQNEGDNWTPRVTVSLGITPNSTDPSITNTIFNLETTISARTIDCVAGASPAQC